MNGMVAVDQQQPPSAFTPLTAVQPPSAADGFALTPQQQQHKWNQQSPSNGASARNIMFGTNQPDLQLPICCGCRQPILDKFVLHVAPDSTWHADCLRCGECRQPLDESCTCFVRNGMAYCKNDYTKLFGTRCQRCHKQFSRLDSIMKVRSSNGGNVMFHSECFMCYVCGCPLPPGAHFGLLPDCGHGEIVLCERDFEERGPLIQQQQQQQQQQQRMVRPGMMLSHDSPMLENHHPFAGAPPGHFGIPGPDGSIVMLESTPLMSVDEHRSQHQAVPQQQQQQPPQHHHHQPSTKQETAAAAHNKDKSASSVSSCGSNVQNGQQNTGGGGKSRSRESKTTRVRTVLNEKQLNTLRACYAANPRPDALMKEQLVEMTGLSPRVIRVWFQNKRCKDKKKSMLMKLQAQHLSSSDKVAALQSAMPLIAQDAVQHSTSSPMPGGEVPIHAFSQQAWKSLADFAMNAEIDPSAPFQQFVNGGPDVQKQRRNNHNNINNNNHLHNTSDGLSDVDDDDDDDDDDCDDGDDEVLGADDDDEMMNTMNGGGSTGVACSSTSPSRMGATTATTNGSSADEEHSSSFHHLHMQQQRQQILVAADAGSTMRL